jgi:hypothetical protein
MTDVASPRRGSKEAQNGKESEEVDEEVQVLEVEQKQSQTWTRKRQKALHEARQM